MLTFAVLAVPAMAGAGAHPGARPPPAARQVSYRGYTFTVPRGWPVVRLAGHPGWCVHFDRHVVYLGAPGQNPKCPASLIGTTEALLIQPSAAHAVPRSAENPVARQITVITRRVTVTATYAAHRGRIDAILASASLPAPVLAGPGQTGPRDTGPGQTGASGTGPGRAVPEWGTPGGLTAGPSAAVPASATTFTGQGFDACTAPAASDMGTLLRRSPFQAVGIYLGGSDRACAQTNLSAAWVSQQAAAGWHFIPLYVGPQAAFGELTSAAASQAVSAARDAVSQARLLGFGPRTPIYYDMEAYPSGQTSRVLTFLSSWTQELHALGYISGAYSSSLSGVLDLVNNYRNPAYTMPDLIFDALWNGAANTADPSIPASDWAPHRRIHQYAGGVAVSYGGVSLDIDRDFLDVQLAATGGSAQASPAASQASGAVDTFFTGSDGSLWHDWFVPASGWHGPSRIRGSVASQPSAVSSLPGTVQVFVKGANGSLWSDAYSPAHGWSGLRDLGMGELGSRPAAVAQANGVIDVFWRGSADDHLWHARYRPGRGWTGPQNLGGSLASRPSPALSSPGTVSVFWTGPRGRLWHTLRSPGAGWRRPARLEMGRIGGPPAATGQANGVIDVFWKGTSRTAVWRARYTQHGGWSRPRQVSDGVSSNPFVVASAPGSVSAFWKGTDGRLWWAVNQGTGWQAPAQLRMGTLGAGPFATGQPNGVIDVFWKGSADAHLWHARYGEGSWVGPGDLGGHVG